MTGGRHKPSRSRPFGEHVPRIPDGGLLRHVDARVQGAEPDQRPCPVHVVGPLMLPWRRTTQYVQRSAGPVGSGEPVRQGPPARCRLVESDQYGRAVAAVSACRTTAGGHGAVVSSVPGTEPVTASATGLCSSRADDQQVGINGRVPQHVGRTAARDLGRDGQARPVSSAWARRSRMASASAGIYRSGTACGGTAVTRCSRAPQAMASAAALEHREPEVERGHPRDHPCSSFTSSSFELPRQGIPRGAAATG